MAPAMSPCDSFTSPRPRNAARTTSGDALVGRERGAGDAVESIGRLFGARAVAAGEAAVRIRRELVVFRMDGSGAQLRQQRGAPRIVPAGQLVFGQRVRVGACRVRPITQLLVIRSAARARKPADENQQRETSHFFFFRPAALGAGSVAACGAGGLTSDRESSARYASTRGSSGRRAFSCSQTARAAKPSPAR